MYGIVLLLRAHLDCLTKPCDIIHIFHQNFSQMELSGVYNVCLTFSLLWETKIVHTKLGNNIKEFNFMLTICSMDQMDMYTKYTNDSVTDFLLLSAT